MAMVTGLAYHLQESRPEKGRIVLLYQPSEENGKGGERVIDDPRFQSFLPDYIFAIHNLPGYELGRVVLSNNHFASASRGMFIKLTGKSSHAAEPEMGINPGYGMAKMMAGFADVLKIKDHFQDFILVTPVHARLGNLAYGISPGEGVIHLTLRSYRNDDMEALSAILENVVHEIAQDEKLKVEIAYEEDFPATVNNSECARMINTVAQDNGIKVTFPGKPFKWSEDFGHFTSKFPGALFGLGSGKNQPALHNPDFDFPDSIIPVGINLYKGIYDMILNS
jgi:amidohydrolase